MGNQCTAHSSRTGERCRKAPIAGSNVCRTHGGAAPQVQAKARARILALVDPALAELARIVNEGEADNVRLAAARDILDRAGLGAKQIVANEHTGKDGGPIDSNIQVTFVRAAQEDK